MTVSKSYKLFILIFFFYISPLVSSLLVLIFYSLKNKKDDLIFLFLPIAGFLALLNANKIFVSDVVGYYNIFEQAYNFQFLDYMKKFSKTTQPILYIFNYIIHYLMDFSPRAYVFIVTFVPYLILFFSIKKILDKSNLENSFYFIILLSIMISPLIFQLSGHLIRQFFSFSLLFLAISMDNRLSMVFFYIISLLTHAMSIIFFPIIFFIFFRKKINNYDSTLIFGIAFILILIIFALLFFDNYYLQRWRSLFLDAQIMVRSVGIGYKILTVLSIIFCIINFFKKKNYFEFIFSNFNLVFYFFIFYSLFSLSLNKISIRYAMYLYVSLPIIIFISVKDIYVKYINIINLIILLLFLFIFYIYIEKFTNFEYNILQTLTLIS